MLALVLAVPEPDAELAADALWALGVLAVEERDVGGIVELWTSLGDDAAAVTAAAEGFPSRWRWRLVEVDDADAERWREHAHPTWVQSDLVTCPAWVPFDPPSLTTVIRIEPGVTFGLGDHPTTVLSLRALRPLVWPGATVLDVGCGSGILGIAAALFGASTVDALDITPAAVNATIDNAARNNVAGKMHVSLTALAEITDAYDVVVANILAPTLLGLAPDLLRVLADDGALVIGGILAARHAHVTAALEPLRVVDRQTLEGWVALTLRR
jgi:ribosomal protein L11 methyltransferase